MVKENGKKENESSNGAPSKTNAPEIPASTQLADILVLLEKSVRAKDTKIIVGRLMRQTAAVRSRLEPGILTTFIEEAVPAQHSTRSFLVSQLIKVGQPDISWSLKQQLCRFHVSELA